QVYVDQMENAYIKPYSAETARWEDVENNALMPVFNGEASVADVAADIVSGVEEVLANEK
ncbi:MAG: sugar ABC transporter substrate-binding protein, partial [Trichococcus flocculiformis]